MHLDAFCATNVVMTPESQLNPFFSLCLSMIVNLSPCRRYLFASLSLPYSKRHPGWVWQSLPFSSLQDQREEGHTLYNRTLHQFCRPNAVAHHQAPSTLDKARCGATLSAWWLRVSQANLDFFFLSYQKDKTKYVHVIWLWFHVGVDSQHIFFHLQCSNNNVTERQCNNTHKE